MEIAISSNEVIAEMQQKFPRETEICIQSIQIKKLQEMLEGNSLSGESNYESDS